MKKFYVSFLSLAILAALVAGFVVSAQTDEVFAAEALVSPNLVISQFQAGGTSNANDEFLEIKNTSVAAVDLNGYRISYRSDNGTVDRTFFAWTTSTMLEPGQFYLLASTSYTGSVTPNATYNNTACQCALAAAAGGLAIRQGPADTGAVIDAVGWGTGSNIFFEGTRTTAPGNSNSKIRAGNGCTDTDNNASDFSTSTPSAPRNASTTPSACSGSGGSLFAAINANPTTVSPGGNTLLTITVVPATTPPSTGIMVIANLSTVGGSGSQPFFDNGTDGDVTAGDNVYSYRVTIPAGTTGGTRNVTAVASDTQARSVNLSINLTINAPPANEDPLLFGNPSDATGDVSNENNYLMQKVQYSLSYNRSRATANWVAWRLDSSWIGNTERQDDFRNDPALPAGWYQVQDNDYSGSGFDRGHMTPSGDRTNSVVNNSATFLMTNIVPQLAANNQGSWNDFEIYLRTLAQQGNEIYIVSGVVGNIGTIAQGKIVVPQYTWKVVLILPLGDNDLQRTRRSTKAFGIVVPNFPPLNQQAQWEEFDTTVDAVEALTGYDFFSNIPITTQEMIERRPNT